MRMLIEIRHGMEREGGESSHGGWSLGLAALPRARSRIRMGWRHGFEHHQQMGLLESKQLKRSPREPCRTRG